MAACAGPMGQREAQNLAATGLREFCHAQPCGATKLLSAQKIKNRWLVDYDGAGGRYTVIVEANGNTQVNVWDKNLQR